MPVVSLSGVRFAYGRGPAVLDGIDLVVERGEFVGVAGPNGGGKTTLMRLIVGLDRPAAGRVELFGSPPEQSHRRSRVGYLPQRATLGLDAPITVRELVTAGRSPLRGPLWPRGAKDRRAIEEAIERVGLSATAGSTLQTLSGGQRQRAFIAKLLAGDPELLILDEPTAGVDAPAQESLAALLDRLRRELGVTILYVSHEFGAIEPTSDASSSFGATSSSTVRRARSRSTGTTPRIPTAISTMSLLDLEFMRLALATGAVVGILAPAVGFFLVQRRMSLIGDGVGHLAFAGVAAGYLFGISPVATALVASVAGAIGIEWLRGTHRAAGDQALALFFYGGIALGVVFVSAAEELNANLFTFLFGSILTVTRGDLALVAALGARRAGHDPRSVRRARRDRDRRGGGTGQRDPGSDAQRGARRARRADDRALDADRRHPPDRCPDGVAR